MNYVSRWHFILNPVNASPVMKRDLGLLQLILHQWMSSDTFCTLTWCWERFRARGEGVTEFEMVGWHHWLNGHEFEQTGREWSTGKPGVLQSLGSQAARHDLATEQQQLSPPDWRPPPHHLPRYLQIRRAFSLGLWAHIIPHCLIKAESDMCSD